MKRPTGVLVQIGGNFRKNGATWSYWGAQDGCVYRKRTKNGKSTWEFQTRIYVRPEDSEKEEG